jgi:tetratricopeptide (TPR) repeat protein
MQKKQHNLINRTIGNKCLYLLPILMLFACNMSLKQRAYKQYERKNYNDAIKSYNKLLERKQIITEYGLWKIAECYFAQKDTPDAMIYYQKCAFTPRDINFKLYDADPLQRLSHHRLADFYLSQKNYSEALRHLQRADSFPRYFPCSRGKLSYYMEAHFKYAQCYTGLDKIDTAIKTIAPYMFYTKEQSYYTMYGGKEFYEQHFLNYAKQLLFKKHDESTIKKELERSAENLVFTTKQDTNCLGKICYIKAYTHFFNDTIVLTDFGLGIDCDSLMFSRGFGEVSQKSEVEKFKNSLFYKQIMGIK